jgi:hypothetical protein
VCVPNDCTKYISRFFGPLVQRVILDIVITLSLLSPVIYDISIFFSETTWSMVVKLGRNVHGLVLYKFFFFFISLQSEIRHKNKIPQVAKRMFSVFCLLNVYFSTNFDNI